jgi:hypothetical protein
MSEVRLIDPTWDEILARVPQRTGTLLKRVMGPSEGVFAQVISAAQAMLVCWWTDALERRHVWIRESDRRTLYHDLPVAQRLSDKQNGLLPRHPLEWIAPTGSCGWRQRILPSGEWSAEEFLVVCRCGVAGTPEGIAWMGACCGPCHDREEDEMPRMGAEVCPVRFRDVEHAHLTPQGQLLVQHGNRLGQATLAFYADLDAVQPRWQRPWQGSRPSSGGSWIVAGSRLLLGLEDRIDLYDLETGKPLGALSEMERINSLAAGGESLSILHRPPGRNRLRFLQWEEGQPLPQLRASPYTDLDNPVYLLASSRGRAVLVREPDRLTVFDTATARVLLRYRPETRLASFAWAADGSLIGIDGAQLMRWRAVETVFTTHEHRGPDDEVTLGAAPVHPRLTWANGPLLWAPEGLEGFDANTLQPTFRFRPATALYTAPLLSNDGRLVVGTVAGLVVWPWREMTR